MNKFESLNVFTEAHKLVLLIYKYSARFPKSELFGLVNQVRRAASSVAANIVEGNSRNYNKEHVQFVFIAIGSLEETKYHILLAKDLRYLSETEYKELQNQAELVGKLLNGLKKYLVNLK